MLNTLIRYFLENRIITALLIVLILGAGIATAPFNWDRGNFPSDPVSVDAIPDIGENQQIIFTKWAGKSPQDVEDQITYPLTTALMGIPGVKSIRSSSIFGASSIYILFEDATDFYWSRSRILEKLATLPTNTLPTGVSPVLGPDATALGQVYWYTLEGRDKEGNPTGGWDLHEIRTIQDFYVKYALQSVQGVAEVASIGGYVQEYQVEVNPDALKTYGITLSQVLQSVKNANQDTGAKTIEINKAEYFVRGLGYIQSIEDLELAVVAVHENIPVMVKDVAVVHLGPAIRRGVLDKDGAEVVGGSVIARYGANPMQVISTLKQKIETIASGLPQKTLQDGTVSQLTIVPFYDRSQLIQETLGTLEEALTLEIIITILVVLVMVFNFRASFLISGMLPIAVLMVFVAMRYTGVEANIVALSGIIIAIGTMVDLGIVLSENIIKKIKHQLATTQLTTTIYEAASEVSGAIFTAVATTIVSFIPVFALEAAEGKLFRPLAFTKTYALLSALLVTLILMPTIAYWLFKIKVNKKGLRFLGNCVLLVGGEIALSFGLFLEGSLLALLGVVWLVQIKQWYQKKWLEFVPIALCFLYVTWILTKLWLPLGVSISMLNNYLFVLTLIGGVLGVFKLIEHFYVSILGFCLRYKVLFLSIPLLFLIAGFSIWKRTGKEFMPPLDEGSFLLMPSAMPHAGMEQNKRIVQQLDMRLANIPEVALAVGKMGRVASAIDPAPISMFENVINYKSEYARNDKGKRQRFKMDLQHKFVLKSGAKLTNSEMLELNLGQEVLIPSKEGQYFRNWRAHIHSPEDIWKEIIRVTKIPGVTSAPKLQPIETRLVMLQTGMRAPMGIKVFGPDLNTIALFSQKLENILKQVPSVKKEAVFAERVVGKPYLHLTINRNLIARYGLTIQAVQETIESAIGGVEVTSTIEGRERFAVSVRYPRELRDSPDQIKKILVDTPNGLQVPLGDLVEISFNKGPQMIKSENTFLVGYVLFDKQNSSSEIETVEAAQDAISTAIQNGELSIPKGISFEFSGNYENQVRAENRLQIIVPIVLLIIFILLYMQFRAIATAVMVFTGIAIAFSGAFVLIWLYDQHWFLNIYVFEVNLRDLFQIHTINMSVAVWVGFIALFGIATDDGVLMGTYLDQNFKQYNPSTVQEVRNAVTKAGKKRVKAAVMTSATTVIALLPVLTSKGRGADIMVPMAIPAFGGMIMAVITYFIVPVLYAAKEELKIKKAKP